MSNINELLSARQVAGILGFTTQYISHLVRSGQLVAAVKMPGYRGAYLFTTEAVAQFQASREEVAS
jgi:hypothetical protein